LYAAHRDNGSTRRQYGRRWKDRIDVREQFDLKRFAFGGVFLHQVCVCNGFSENRRPNWSRSGLSLWKAFHNRKNWIHLGSKEAGPRVAAMISIVETCRRLNLRVRDYLGSVLPGLANFPINRVAELTPSAWAARN
jgi:hypothetical protein